MSFWKNKKIVITIIIVFLVLVAALYTVLYLIPGITGSLTPTYIINYGKMESSYRGRCVVVRDETCYFSDYSGTITRYINESEKTRIGTRVADIYSGGDKHALYCKKTGFVSYYYDGLEAELTPESVLERDPAEYMNTESAAESVTKDNVEKDDFIYKLVDGGSWYVMLPVTPDQLSTFNMGSNLNLVLDDGTVLKANAQKVVGTETLAVMARVLSYYPDFAKIRTLDVKIVTRETEGLEIPKTAIEYNEDGNPGVYVLGTDGEYHFTRIEILDEQENSVLVTEEQFSTTLEDGTEKIISSVYLYDEILKNAAK